MDDLKFFGRGSGFNPAMGSTAAYFVEGNCLFLIDCGESVYRRIKEANLLDGIKVVYFFCTHTHSDHIGSAGNLMLECKWARNIVFNLVIPRDAAHYKDVANILDAFGGRNFYDVIEPQRLDRLYESFTCVRYKKTTHGDCEAYSLVFYTKDGAVFYSGDSATMGFAEELIMSGAKIKSMYFDVTSKTESDCHLPLVNLFTLMPKELRDCTYCMHFDSQKCVDMASSMGFNVVTTV